MNLYGGLTGRLQAHVAPVQAEDFVTRDCRPTLFDGLRNVLGQNKVAELRVSHPINQDVAVYTLRGKGVTVSGLEAVAAASEYDLGRRIGHRLLALQS